MIHFERYRMNYEQEHLNGTLGYEKEFWDFVFNDLRELPGSQDYKRPWNHTLNPFIQLRPNQLKLKQWQYRVSMQLNKETPRQYLERTIKEVKKRQKKLLEEEKKKKKYGHGGSSSKMNSQVYNDLAASRMRYLFLF